MILDNFDTVLFEDSFYGLLCASVVSYFNVNITAYNCKVDLDVRGKNVILCGKLFSEGRIKSMACKTEKLIVLEHVDKNEIFPITIWKLLSKDSMIPKFLKYYSDYHFSKNELDCMDIFELLLYSLQCDDVEMVIKLFDSSEFLSMMEKIEPDKNCMIVNSIIKSVCVDFVLMDEKYYFVALVNSEFYKFNILKSVGKLYPNCSFALIYHDDIERGSKRIMFDINDKSINVVKGNKYVLNESKGLSNIFKIIDRKVLYSSLNTMYSNVITFMKEKVEILYVKTEHHRREIGKFLFQKCDINGFDRNYKSIYKNVCSDNAPNVKVCVVWDIHEKFKQTIEYGSCKDEFVASFNDKVELSVIVSDEWDHDKYSHLLCEINDNSGSVRTVISEGRFYLLNC